MWVNVWCTLSSIIVYILSQYSQIHWSMPEAALISIEVDWSCDDLADQFSLSDRDWLTAELFDYENSTAHSHLMLMLLQSERVTHLSFFVIFL